MLNKEGLKALSLDEVLNINLDEVPDAGFKIWPDGTYHVVFSEPTVEEVGNDKKPRLTIPYTLVEVLELADPEGETVSAESTGQFGYMLPAGASMFKNDFDEIRAATETTTILEIAGVLKEYHALITLGHRFDKVDKEKVYQSVKAIKPLA